MLCKDLQRVIISILAAVIFFPCEFFFFRGLALEVLLNQHFIGYNMTYPFVVPNICGCCVCLF